MSQSRQEAQSALRRYRRTMRGRALVRGPQLPDTSHSERAVDAVVDAARVLADAEDVWTDAAQQLERAAAHVDDLFDQATQH